MGPSKTPKCHDSHGNFCKVTNSFGDHVPTIVNYSKISSPAAQNCLKFAKILDMSWQVWEVAETKISAGASRVTWPDELNKIVQYVDNM
jgi:hypothetical protein